MALCAGAVSSCEESEVSVIVYDSTGIVFNNLGYVADGVRDGWFQIVVYDRFCPYTSDLAHATKNRAIKTVTLPLDRLDDKSLKKQIFAPIGDLDKKGYGFAAYVKDAQCGVVASGCVNANLAKHRKISIRVENDQQDEPLSRCVEHEACYQGECRDNPDGVWFGKQDVIDPDKCDFELLDTGEFIHLYNGSAKKYIGPALVSTNKGFVVVYIAVGAEGEPHPRVMSWLLRSQGFPVISTYLLTDEENRDLFSLSAAAVPEGISVGGIVMTTESSSCDRAPCIRAYLLSDEGGPRIVTSVRFSGLEALPNPKAAPKSLAWNYSEKVWITGVALENRKFHVFRGNPEYEPPVDLSGWIEQEDVKDSISSLLVDSSSRAFATLAVTNAPSIRVGVSSSVFPARLLGDNHEDAIKKDTLAAGSQVSAVTVAASQHSVLAAYVTNNSSDLSWKIYPASSNEDGALTSTTLPVAPVYLDATSTNSPDTFLAAAGIAQNIFLVKLGASATHHSLSEILARADGPLLSMFKGKQLAIGRRGNQVLVTWLNAPGESGTNAGGYARFHCRSK